MRIAYTAISACTCTSEYRVWGEILTAFGIRHPHIGVPSCGYPPCAGRHIQIRAVALDFLTGSTTQTRIHSAQDTVRCGKACVHNICTIEYLFPRNYGIPNLQLSDIMQFGVAFPSAAAGKWARRLRITCGCWIEKQHLQGCRNYYGRNDAILHEIGVQTFHQH